MGLITSITDSIKKLFSGGEPKRIGIYGPPNAGKCLAANEQILLSDGTCRSISDVFSYVRETYPTAPDVSDEEHETWINCTDAGIQVPALTTELTVMPTTISHVFRQRYRGVMYRVQTESGRAVTASPDHPFITISEAGIGQTRAGDLSTGTVVSALCRSRAAMAPARSHPLNSTSEGRLAPDGGKIDASGVSPLSSSVSLPIMERLEATRKSLEMTHDEFYGPTPRDPSGGWHGQDGQGPGDSVSISLDRVRSIAARLSQRAETEYIHALANSDARWDEVVSIEEVEYDGYIYDLTVPDHHTFVTADGLVVHNTTLANRVARDWTGDAVGPESHVPHETRRARRKENITIERNGSAVTVDIVDTPGVTTKVDYNEFLEHDMTKEDAVRRSREATEGVAEAMHWLREDVDGVIYVLDSTADPFTQVNTMLIGIIESRDLPVLIFANKTDLDESSVQRIVNAFPQHEVIPLSALEGDNMQEVYDEIANHFG